MQCVHEMLFAHCKPQLFVVPHIYFSAVVVPECKYLQELPSTLLCRVFPVFLFMSSQLLHQVK